VQREGHATFHSACDAEEEALQGLSVGLCDEFGAPRLASVEALGDEAASGGFLYISSFDLEAAAVRRGAGFTDVGAALLRALLEAPELAAEWTLAAYKAWPNEASGLSQEEDARMFLRAGFVQTEETAFLYGKFPYLVASPTLIASPLASHAAALAVAIARQPPGPPKPTGVDAELLELVLKQCDHGALLDAAPAGLRAGVAALRARGATVERAHALHAAAARGAPVAVFELLLEFVADKAAALNAFDVTRSTPLMLAVESAVGHVSRFAPEPNTALCRELLRLGARKDVACYRGWTAFDKVARAVEGVMDMRRCFGRREELDASALSNLLAH